jgi:hypothetical protein
VQLPQPDFEEDEDSVEPLDLYAKALKSFETRAPPHRGQRISSPEDFTSRSNEPPHPVQLYS